MGMEHCGVDNCFVPYKFGIECSVVKMVLNTLKKDNMKLRLFLFLPDRRHNGMEISVGRYFISWLPVVNAEREKKN